MNSLAIDLKMHYQNEVPVIEDEAVPSSRTLNGFLRRGSFATDPAAFVADLAAEALRHRAVKHPYLEALGSGTLPDMRWALADFAAQYYGYSRHFPRYLTTVMSRLEDPKHQRALLENLTEESGHYEQDELDELAANGIAADWIVGIPHPQLFLRFANALNVVPSKIDSDAVLCWREMFLAVLTHGAPAEAVGALGLGTENIVRTIYQPFVRALGSIPGLSPRDTVFFPLHTTVDDHHQETLQAISASFATTTEGRVALRRGMLKSLSLRASFWDWMLARAMYPAEADFVV